jgi:hypothetical protein
MWGPFMTKVGLDSIWTETVIRPSSGGRTGYRGQNWVSGRIGIELPMTDKDGSYGLECALEVRNLYIHAV